MANKTVRSEKMADTMKEACIGIFPAAASPASAAGAPPAEKPTVKKKRIFAREEYCVGCRLCEIYCIAAHSEYRGDIVKTFNKSMHRPLPGIFVEERKPLSFGLQCRHCSEPECVKACITGAMRVDPATGLVSNDESRCIGCYTCVLSCPYGVVAMDHGRKKVASKCDMCAGMGGEPACVLNCPNGALYVADAEG